MKFQNRFIEYISKTKSFCYDTGENTLYKIFIVEDDIGIASAITMQIQNWGWQATTVQNFQNIVPEFIQYMPHLVLLDISLPFYNGYHWCTQIRKNSNVPIIFISSASESMNIVMAMNMGADDFIAKPFDSDVLISKMQALLRRSYDFANTSPLLEHRGAILNTGEATVSYNGCIISLSKNEYRILSILWKNKKSIVSREKLMEGLWKTDEFVDENTLTVNVNRLRKKLEQVGLVNFIETKFGTGYIIP